MQSPRRGTCARLSAPQEAQTADATPYDPGRAKDRLEGPLRLFCLTVQERRAIAGALDLATVLASSFGRDPSLHVSLMEHMLDGIEP